MNVKEELLKALAEADENLISGAAFAEKLGVSRNAVWKAVKALEAEGFAIESVTAAGYRLAEENNKLCREIIEAGLKDTKLYKNIMVFDEINSTNSYVKELASQGAEHGTVVIADMQNAGRGRLGRSFVSPSGKGIYMSVLLRPDFTIAESALITSATACAVADSVDKFCNCDTKIKWVNDIYVNNKKICGILTEASFGLEMRSLDYAVVGIGINVHSVGDSFDEELKNTASSIEDETGMKINRNKLCAEILIRLEESILNLKSKKFLKSYRSRELLTGNMITANIGPSKVKGLAVGVDDNCNLIIRLSNGQEKHLASGEANLCRIVKE